MTQVQDIKVLNIDDVQYDVDTMSEANQRLVGIFNEWNQKEASARDEVTILQAAKESLSRQIIDQVRKEQKEAETAEEIIAEADEVSDNKESQ